jgi:hypothetical protein
MKKGDKEMVLWSAILILEILDGFSMEFEGEGEGEGILL